MVAIRDVGSKRGKRLWEFRCDCGNVKFLAGNKVVSGAIQSCGCLLSWHNLAIEEWLSENGFHYQREFTFPDLRFKRCLPFDFAVFMRDGERMIEYQGRQHYEPVYGKQAFAATTNNDHLKETYCLHFGIPLLKIPYYAKDFLYTLDWFLSCSYEEVVLP